MMTVLVIRYFGAREPQILRAFRRMLILPTTSRSALKPQFSHFMILCPFGLNFPPHIGHRDDVLSGLTKTTITLLLTAQSVSWAFSLRILNGLRPLCDLSMTIVSVFFIPGISNISVVKNSRRSYKSLAITSAI